MSKKNKAKFKRHLKQQLLQEIQQTEKEETPVSAPVNPSSSTDLTDKTYSPNATNLPNSPATADATTYNLTQIRYDLKKTGVVVLGLILILVIIYFVDQKNHFLLSFGNWLFETLHINS